MVETLQSPNGCEREQLIKQSVQNCIRELRKGVRKAMKKKDSKQFLILLLSGEKWFLCNVIDKLSVIASEVDMAVNCSDK